MILLHCRNPVNSDFEGTGAHKSARWMVAALFVALAASGCSSPPSHETASKQIPETVAAVQVQESQPLDQNVEEAVVTADESPIPASDPLPVSPIAPVSSTGDPSLSDPSSSITSSSPSGLIAPISAPTATSIEYSFNSSVRPHAPTGDNLGHSFNYDPNGNMTGLSTYATYTAMRYNHFNKLDTVQSGSAVTKYLYDDSGNRIAKMVSGQVTERYFGSVEQKNGETHHYYFHGSRRIAERNVSSGQLSFYHPDHLGSASVVTDNRGAELSRVDYYEFGATRQELGLRKETFTYNDKRIDPETDFNDYGARMYAAKFMRFTSADTIVPEPGDPQSLNRYAYVRNNPTRYVDPTGHAALEFHYVMRGMEIPEVWGTMTKGAGTGRVDSSRHLRSAQSDELLAGYRLRPDDPGLSIRQSNVAGYYAGGGGKGAIMIFRGDPADFSKSTFRHLVTDTDTIVDIPRGMRPYAISPAVGGSNNGYIDPAYMRGEMWAHEGAHSVLLTGPNAPDVPKGKMFEFVNGLKGTNPLKLIKVSLSPDQVIEFTADAMAHGIPKAVIDIAPGIAADLGLGATIGAAASRWSWVASGARLFGRVSPWFAAGSMIPMLFAPPSPEEIQYQQRAFDRVGGGNFWANKLAEQQRVQGNVTFHGGPDSMGWIPPSIRRGP